MSEPAGAGTAEEEARPGRGLVYLGEDMLADILGLPEGWRVAGVSGDFARTAVAVLVEGDGLPEVPAGEAPPTLPGGTASTEYLFDAGDGERWRRVWVRWRWRPGEPQRPRYSCGFGGCEEPAVHAFAVRARRDVSGPEDGGRALLLCAEHRDTPPACWEEAGGPAHVVAGRYCDGSAVHDTVFGPYTRERAQALAAHLTDACYQLMRWDAYPLTRTWPPDADTGPAPAAPADSAGGRGDGGEGG